MLTTTYGKKEFALIGKILLQTKPQAAEEIIAAYCNPVQEKAEKDFTKMQSYFSIFCHLQHFEPEDFHTTFKGKRADITRTFIAIMLHIYLPQAYLQPLENLIIGHGFIKHLSLMLNQNKGNISKMIREVILWEKQYEDFADTVHDLLNQMK